MEQLQLFRGDTVRIKGKHSKETVAIALINDDCPIHTIQLNKVVRKNVNVEVGDSVVVEPYPEVQYGTRVHIVPIADTLEGVTGDVYDTILKPYFFEAYRPVRKGDVFTVKSGLREVEFKVIDIEPADCCMVAPETSIDYQGNPIQRQE